MFILRPTESTQHKSILPKQLTGGRINPLFFVELSTTFFCAVRKLTCPANVSCSSERLDAQSCVSATADDRQTARQAWGKHICHCPLSCLYCPCSFSSVLILKKRPILNITTNKEDLLTVWCESRWTVLWFDLQ